jgi:hypothetical protein
MKTIASLVMGILFACSASAQFDVSNFSASLSGNYTMYKKDFKESTPGIKLDLGYSIDEKTRIMLGYTYQMPIKVASVITSTDGIESTETPSEVKFDFTTISLAGNYSFINSEEEKFNLYGILGASLVMVKYKEEPKSPLPAGTIDSDQAEPGKENGFVINLGLGAQYNLGTIRLFADGGIGIPANQTGNTYTYNPIPFHILFNAGVRIPFGTREFED